jgi:hypothetical protein
MNKKDLKRIKRAERNKKVYDKYIDILNGLKKKQDKIIEKYVRKKENEEIKKIREKLK